MQILFISHNRLGDAVLSSCILNQLNQQYPDARFTIAAGPVAAPIFKTVPNLERLIVVKKQSLSRHWLKLWAKCLFHRWDIIVDCRGSGISWLLWTKQRFYKYPANTKHIHRLERYAGMMQQTKTALPRIWIDKPHRQKAQQLLGNSHHYIAIAPAANWRAKTWRAEHFIELITQLRKPDGPYPDTHILVIAAKHELSQVQPILDAFPFEQLIKIIGTQSLLTIAACIQHSRCFIGNDSGLMHIAAAVGTKTIGLFGPTDKNKYGPRGDHCLAVTTPESPEALMNYPGFNYLTCDSLMDSLTVNSVLDAINSSRECKYNDQL